MNTMLTILLALCLLPGSSHAEEADSALLRRLANMKQFAKAFPQERVYVHFDNTSYFKGEQIWYSAYVVSDERLQATNLSRILYVELLNPIGYPVETQKLPIVDGRAHGSIQLSDTLNAGFYEVRAYTQWMLNFTTGDRHGWDRLRRSEARRHYGDRFQRYLEGNAGVFSRVLPVYEKVDGGRYMVKRMPRLPRATASMAAPAKERLFVDFYPEGGNLVQDVPTRIALQAHNAEGRTLNVAGALYRRGDSIGYFRTDYAGRGVFAVTPDSTDGDELTEGLQLRITYLGRNYRFDLPKPKKRGYSLSVMTAGQQLKAMVARNGRTEGMRLGLSITSRGHAYYYSMVDLRQAKEAVDMIDQRQLPTGVNVVTLFTEEGKVLAQRMVFVKGSDLTCLQFRADSVDNGPRQPYEKIALSYQLTDDAGRPVRAQVPFSIAVTDADSREETYDDTNLLSYLLLASEVKGFIPHAAYYFEADDQEHRAALDQLLMVQGWTRYDFEQMMSGRHYEPMLAIERGLNFSGRIWDDNDYQSRRFWKLQNEKPMWVYSELYAQGDTLPRGERPTTVVSPEGVVTENAGSPQLILTGEARVDTTGCFHLNITPFYGKGRIALMLNKQSIDELGLVKGGVFGHNFRWNTIKRPAFLLGKRIEPLNQYSPLPRNYDYYETAALTDPIDRNMFRYGFMAVTKENQERLSYYDPITQSYVLPGVTKKVRRRWSDLHDVIPACVMDVKDMMAWLSNIYGDLSDFKFREHSPYYDNNIADDGQGFLYDMMMEDARWLDKEFGTNQFTRQMLRSINNDVRTTQYQIDNEAHFARLAEMLYIFGLDGMNSVYVGLDSVGNRTHYTNATGQEKYLPINMHFFPVNENFRTLELYADTYDRRLTHQPGRYHEAVFSYDPYATTNDRHPLTSIFNFIVGDTYSNSHPLPEFMGFRINFQGFTQPTEFFVPNYDWEPEPDETDYRRTVYWDPEATTDADGRARIEFFNNGFSRRLSVSAEGITAEGAIVTSKNTNNEE